jgi:hypothetical protein
MTQSPKPKQDAITGHYQPNGAAAKAGLNKAILDGAPAQFLSMLRYKAAEAGIVYAEAPTRQLKPSQRCHACWTVHPKRLEERWHACPCGANCHRDVNAVLVLLHWGMEYVLSVLLAWFWLHNNRSQELAVYHGYGSPAHPPGFVGEVQNIPDPDDYGNIIYGPESRNHTRWKNPKFLGLL